MVNPEIHVAFIDLEKAYDSISRVRLWAALRTLNTAPAFIILLYILSTYTKKILIIN